MAHNRELSEQPLVALEADKLLGMRQVATVGSTGGAADCRAAMSRLLSKIGVEVPPITDARAEMSRLLSKIGEVED